MIRFRPWTNSATLITLLAAFNLAVILEPTTASDTKLLTTRQSQPQLLNTTIDRYYRLATLYYTPSSTTSTGISELLTQSNY